MDSILIVAGEKSGENYGADLVREFRKGHPSISFFGIGGKRMASQGVEIIFPMEDLAVIGLAEVVSELPRIRRIFRGITREVKLRRPAAAVLIDSPDFNLRLAKKLKKLGIPVLYYISPTVWAWRKGRLKIIQKNVEKMLLIFPFESALYNSRQIPAVYVGHPLVERVKTTLNTEEFFKKYGLAAQKKLIALLSGSRRSEVRYHWPILIEAIPRIQQEFPVQFVLVLAEGIERSYLESLTGRPFPEVRIITQDAYEALAASDLVLSACGTANLEAALLGTPVVAFYRMSPLTYYAGVRLVRIRNYSIVNILAGRRVIPELIQKRFSINDLMIELRKIMADEGVRNEMKENFRKIRALLGEESASRNAARELARLINKS
jgi:lipid-A-disaccharide synthase